MSPRVPLVFKHSAPPLAGVGLVQVRVLVWVPVLPQAVTLQALQLLQALQPPGTGLISEHESFVPLFEPLQDQFQEETLSEIALGVPEEHGLRWLSGDEQAPLMREGQVTLPLISILQDPPSEFLV